MVTIVVQHSFAEAEPVDGWVTYESIGKSTVLIAGPSDEVGPLVGAIKELFTSRGIEADVSASQVVARRDGILSELVLSESRDVLVLGPNDQLVIAFSDPLSMDRTQRIKAELQQRMPLLAGVVVVDGVSGLAAYRPDQMTSIDASERVVRGGAGQISAGQEP